MNNYISTKLTIISFVLMIMVVYLHSFNTTVNFSSGSIQLQKGYATFIQFYFGSIS